MQLKPLIDPFKDKYRFWTGLCLIVRLMLTVVFSFTPTLQSRLINNYIILLTVGAMIVFTNIRVPGPRLVRIAAALSTVT